MKRVLNIFETVKPVSSTAPAAARRRRTPSRAVVALDRLGRQRVPLAPRADVGFVIESHAQAQASVLRRAAMRRRRI